jgi:hypothetical protein
MHLSVEALGDRHRRRARLQKRLVTIVFPIALGWGIARKDSHQVHSIRHGHSGTVRVYTVFLSFERGGRTEGNNVDNLTRDSWSALEDGDHVPYRYVPFLPSLSSSQTSVDWLVAIGGGIAVAFCVLLALGAVFQREWYEGKLYEPGDGPLVVPPPRAKKKKKKKKKR